MSISNSNWTEWSTIQRVIGRVISKSAEREARGRFEITSTITRWIARHEIQLLIDRNYNKTDRFIYSTAKLHAEKKAIQVQLAGAWWRVQLYKRMTCVTVQLRLKSGLLMTNQIREFWYSCD